MTYSDQNRMCSHHDGRGGGAMCVVSLFVTCSIYRQLFVTMNQQNFLSKINVFSYKQLFTI